MFCLLYVGPDQVMPVLSVLGAALGGLMLIRTKVVEFFRRAAEHVTRRSRS